MGPCLGPYPKVPSSLAGPNGPDILYALRESRRGHWRLGGLEAGGSVLQVFLKGVIDGAWKVRGKGGRPHLFR